MADQAQLELLRALRFRLLELLRLLTMRHQLLKEGEAVAHQRLEERVVELDGSGTHRTLEEALANGWTGRIRLGPGRHVLQQARQLPDGVHLLGAGPDTTILEGPIEESALLDLVGRGACRLEGFTIQASSLAEGENGALVIAGEERRVEVRDCVFLGHGADASLSGIALAGSVHADVRRCQFRDLDAGLAADDDVELNVVECTSERNDVGFFLSGACRGQVTDSTCRANRKSGLVCLEDSIVRIERNVITDTEGPGIFVRGRSAPVIRSNTCHANAHHGIEVRDRARPTIQGNVCRSNARSGIAWWDRSSGVARENTVESNGAGGITLAGRACADLERNVCRGNGMEIAYFEDAGSTARENTCAGGKNGEGVGISVAGTAHTRLERNHCTDHDLGIFCMEEACVNVQANTCTGNRVGLLVAGSAVVVAEGNLLKDNLEHGLAFDEQTSGIARGNVASGNGEYGIHIGGQTAVQLEDNRAEGNGKQGISIQEREVLDGEVPDEARSDLFSKLRRDITIAANVEQYGWHAQAVYPLASNPSHEPFVYSIGVQRTHGHPEFLVVGMNPENGGLIIQTLVERIAAGERFHAGDRLDQVIQPGYQVALQDVPPHHYRALFGAALDFYDSAEFEVLQVVIPDKQKRYPGEPGCDPAYIERQDLDALVAALLEDEDAESRPSPDSDDDDADDVPAAGDLLDIGSCTVGASGLVMFGDARAFWGGDRDLTDREVAWRAFAEQMEAADIERTGWAVLRDATGQAMAVVVIVPEDVEACQVMLNVQEPGSTTFLGCSVAVDLGAMLIGGDLPWEAVGPIHLPSKLLLVGDPQQLHSDPRWARARDAIAETFLKDKPYRLAPIGEGGRIAIVAVTGQSPFQPRLALAPDGHVVAAVFPFLTESGSPAARPRGPRPWSPS